jgi:hypothetical protein
MQATPSGGEVDRGPGPLRQLGQLGQLGDEAFDLAADRGVGQDELLVEDLRGERDRERAVEHIRSGPPDRSNHGLDTAARAVPARRGAHDGDGLAGQDGGMRGFQAGDADDGGDHKIGLGMGGAGNGARCAARFAVLHGLAGPRLTFETLAGLISG